MGKTKISGLAAALRMKCPACREGNLFLDPNPYHLKMMGEMPEYCPVCSQRFRLEPGFYFGAAYVSYGLMVGWNLFVALLIILIYGNLFNHFLEMMTACITTTLIISPAVFRYSRVFYLYFFVRYKIPGKDR